MTHLALQLQSAGMHFVAERNRLYGRRVLPLRERDRVADQTYHAHRRNGSRKPHMLRCFICSARCSEARIESDRIVIVGFCHPQVTKLEPSTTNRFLMSWL